MSDIPENIKQILQKHISIASIEIIDQSDKHKTHPSAQEFAGGHFTMLIVSKDFQNKNLLQRHRMVYDPLKNAFQSQIHALSIHAFTPEEFERRNRK